MSITERIAAIQAQRDKAVAECDAQIAALKGEAQRELEEARARVQALESVLGAQKTPEQPKPQKINPYAGTDFGDGVGGRGERVTSAQAFRDELAELRERGAAKRRRA